jgi:hypothetical protein
VTFTFLPLRFEFRARETICFPPDKAANVLRGALGMALHDTPGWSAIFHPEASAGPSGFASPPRPFVFRVRHLDGVQIQPRMPFHVDMNVFRNDPADVVALRDAFAAFPGAELIAVGGSSVTLDLSPRAAPGAIEIDFLTPTELRHNNELVPRPEFPVLFARIRDRIANLRRLYGAGTLDLDFAGMDERAMQIRMTHCDIGQKQIERRSGRTGQSHPIGGFRGSARYEGPLGEFLPWLEAARHTGVGRQCVWGKGEIAVRGIT